jgi:hypothetical protein
MDDINELLWRMYAENMNHVRHVESQRSTITTVFLTLSGAVLTVMAVQWKDNRTPHWGLSVILILIGIIGAVFATKLYELYKEHTERARTYRKALAARNPEARIEEIKDEADKKWPQEAPYLLRLPVHVLWLGPHLFVLALGALIIITSTFL